MTIENLDAEFEAYQSETDRKEQAKEMELPDGASWPEIRAAQLKRVTTGASANFKIQSGAPQNSKLKNEGKANPDLNN